MFELCRIPMDGHASFLLGLFCPESQLLQSIIAAWRFAPWNECAVPLKSEAMKNPCRSILTVCSLSTDHVVYCGDSLAMPGPRASSSIQAAPGKRRYKQTRNVPSFFLREYLGRNRHSA